MSNLRAGEEKRLYANAPSVVTPTVYCLGSCPTAAPTSSQATPVCPSPSGGGQTYYVVTTGSDSNPGIESSPFQTIQKCASTAKAGDTCLIHSGTYRETVTPSSSGTASAPITFAAYNNEKVIVSGADVVPAAWSPDSGSVYKTPMSWDLGRGYNQVFVDGQMVMEARYPYTPFSGILTPNDATAQSTTTVPNTEGAHDRTITLYDSALTQASGFWNGATLVLDGDWDGNHPFAIMTGLVTSSNPGVLTAQSDGAYDRTPKDGAPIHYHLVGTRNALDQPGEWVRGSDGNLYLWAPNSDNPSGHQVEAKRRVTAFNLNGLSWVTLRGLNVFAANIITDSASSHDTLDGITATYVSYFTLTDLKGAAFDPDGPGDPSNTHAVDSGIILAGSDNVLQNSVLAYTVGNIVNLTGSRGKIFNNTIHDLDFACGIGISGADYEVTHNSIYNVSEEALCAGGQHGKILYNNIYKSTLRLHDAGPLYTSGTESHGTEIAYNWVHDSGPAENPYGFTAIYLDNASGGFVVHHNVTWNVAAGINLNTDSRQTEDNKVYNNTVLALNGSIGPGSPPAGVHNEIKNNIFNSGNIGSDTSPDMVNNIYPGTDPQFVDPSNHNYHLQAGSPGVDRGLQLSPWTDGYSGSAPDIGAYEYGGTDWTAGANATLGLTLSLNQTTFSPGDILRVGLQVGNPGQSFNADFYFGYLLPDGVTAVFLTSLAPLNSVTARVDGNPQAFKPLAANVLIPQGLNVTLNDVFVSTFSGNEAVGTYVFFALLTPPSACADGRVDAGDILVIDTKSLSFSFQ